MSCRGLTLMRDQAPAQGGMMMQDLLCLQLEYTHLVFSGFISEEGNCEEGEIHEDSPICSILMQTSKAFSPVDHVSCHVDKHVIDMVNQLFDHGMWEDSYKEVAVDKSTKRPGDCPALSPVKCNMKILEALKQDARKTDFHMKVNKDILKAATIIMSLLVLDKVAQDEGNAIVAHEVSMINGPVRPCQ
ncbi:hypothetical protein E2C01_060120 [Portunus trituberculatus]|uniref:Uncharacterized protein n=1 Tax=Portunus trituberculatus TaxID=210409 RepID=A0A5B7H9L2_PORTR|nr:hypothetical protein [Portunus trituberculatus]